MFDDPVIEQYRVPGKNGYVGTFTLAYPSKRRCIVLGFVSSQPLKKSQVILLKNHVLSKNRDLLIFYRYRHQEEVEKIYQL